MEATTEVPGGRRVGDRSCPERVEERGIVATDLEVVEDEPTTHRVVGDVQDVVHLAVRTPPLQNRQLRVEGLDEPDLRRELVHGADTATRDRMAALRDLVVDRVSGELRSGSSWLLSALSGREAVCDLPCSSRYLSSNRWVHLKASGLFVVALPQPSTHRPLSLIPRTCGPNFGRSPTTIRRSTPSLPHLTPPTPSWQRNGARARAIG